MVRIYGLQKMRPDKHECQSKQLSKLHKVKKKVLGASLESKSG